MSVTGSHLLLTELGLERFIKTIGGKGLHIVLPIQRIHTWEEIRTFAKAVAEIRCSSRAKQAASELVFGKEVTLQTYGKDKYKHTLADVLLPDGTNVNHTLVKDGWCWWYRKYAPGDTGLEKLAGLGQ